MTSASTFPDPARPRRAEDRVLPLGDPRLRVPSSPVDDVDDPRFREHRERLEAALDAFRVEHGFGRGIAAPQIGIPLCFISLNLGDGTRSLINPVITWRSPETFALWDDCMCFPHLLVRVRRHLSISITYLDEEGRPRSRERAPQAESELLQHEVDHLRGVLATDLAADSRSIIYRSAYEADPATFQRQVDYVIRPTT